MPSVAATDIDSSRVRCNECGHDIPKGNVLLHSATCARQQRPARSSQKRRSSDISLLVAYVLWASLGITGIHHAYLGRSHQAVGWYATAAMFGFGWVRDGFLLPYYVSLANDRDVEAKFRAATVEARGGIPKWSVLRIAAMAIFGRYLGWVASCLVVLPDNGAWSRTGYQVLQIIGSGIGVWLVGNMGEETVLRVLQQQQDRVGDCSSAWRTLAHLVASCFAGSAFLGRPVLGGIVYATRYRRYCDSMVPATSVSRRLLFHVVWCTCFTALMTLAIYNHGGIVVNGEKVYVHEAIKNAYQSKFWQEFDWEKFQERFRESSGQGGGEYLIKTFDIEGERMARRTLGVSRNAPHSEIRTAYKKLALKYHPDKIGSDVTEQELEEANRQFIRVQEAYDVMSKIEQRRKKKSGAGRQGENASGGGGSGGGEGSQSKGPAYGDEM